MPDSTELPEQGEIVIATVTKIMDHGAYVTLDEYDAAQGFLHISEIAPGWIRSVSKHVKAGEKKVLLVKRVSASRADVDLSLKQVSADQKKKKLLEVKKYEKGRTLLESVCQKAGITTSEADKLEEALYDKFDGVYEAFIEVARGGTGPIDGLGLDKKVTSAISETASKIRLPSVEIRGIMEISSRRPDGVEVIRSALSAASKADGTSVSYLGAPKYRISVTSDDFKTAEKSLKPIISKIQQHIEKKKGTFSFVREESKKTRDA